MGMIAYDDRSFIVNGTRELIISGAVHYPRSTPAMWPRIFAESKRAGLNCIETYVFWEGHEPREGAYNFTGRYDLRRFILEAGKAGLYVILRIGPYVCAEWNFGGLAWWLLTKKGIQTRTWNTPFMDAVERWVRVLGDRVGDLQFTRGGPIIMAQAENEYAGVAKRTGKDGQRYLDWSGKVLRRAGFDVPLIMCIGASEGAVETLNGFGVWHRAEELRKKRSKQPLLWTENWTGWYDMWGYPHNVRTPRDITYEVMRFIGVGGTGVNYYMWHGGTNFDRDGMFLQTTSYDFSAPLDEYGLPTVKLRELSMLHGFLKKYSGFLLNGRKLQAKMLRTGENGEDIAVYPYRKGRETLSIAVNGTPEKSTVSAGGATFELSPRSAAAVVQTGRERGTLVYRSIKKARKPIRRRMTPTRVHLSWRQLPEPLPGTGPDSNREYTEVKLPHNMLTETYDETDYGWYRTTVRGSKDKTVVLTARVEDLLSVWVNGAYVDSGPKRLFEARAKPADFSVSIDVPLKKGSNEIVLQVAASGLIKHDYQLGRPQQTEVKGLLSDVFLDRTPLKTKWDFGAGLWGERARLFDPCVTAMAPWKNVRGRTIPQCWYKADCALTDRMLADRRPWALDIGELTKGMIWVNGRCIGRYWQVSSAGAPPKTGWHTSHIVVEPGDKPPQRFYHIPAEWLHPGQNTIVLFEERGARPENLKLVRRA